ncbi:hypothetical protein Dda_7401 [Drechslerella dactyloides]|uniref:Uncharacterized protein n=1 Tax=Drechslerella dactyloides TaxID=74499 RepID=A0AAD6ITB5_DREDA|nr:hypothetical protein Dda_7401 [Drechslerella dactyloides]
MDVKTETSGGRRTTQEKETRWRAARYIRESPFHELVIRASQFRRAKACTKAGCKEPKQRNSAPGTAFFGGPANHSPRFGLARPGLSSSVSTSYDAQASIRRLSSQITSESPSNCPCTAAGEAAAVGPAAVRPDLEKKSRSHNVATQRPLHFPSGNMMSPTSYYKAR